MKFNINNLDKTYIIAEMSANHAGSLERALKIIREAKKAGADCIKIQTYTPDTLTIDCDNKYFMVQNGTWNGENLYKLYGKAYTPWEWQKRLKEEADKVGIDFLSTPFDNTAVDFLEDIGIEFYKVASFEIVDIPLIKYIASKGKPMIISTGMASREEIKEALEAAYSMGNHDICLLKCSSAYPADPEDMHLSTIPDMIERYKVPVGLSDHSMGHFSAVLAVAEGAKIIEKHFCLGREIENPDASFSMAPWEFAQMVSEIRKSETALGKPTYGVSKQEESSIVFRRSIFAVKDIEKGEYPNDLNVRIIRPGYGIKPKYIDDIKGLRFAQNVEFGTPISFDLFEKGAILFLTNNDNTQDLYRWLSDKEPYVVKMGEKLTSEMLKALEPSFIISFNYRHIIKEDVIEFMNGKIINLHTSLLPYNRGSSPNFFSFYDNTPKGVTIHVLDKGLDTGDILVNKEVNFDTSKETFKTSYDTLLCEIKELFKENWDSLKNGEIQTKPQVGKGTYHTMKDLELIRSKNEFSWEDVIDDTIKAIKG